MYQSPASATVLDTPQTYSKQSYDKFERKSGFWEDLPSLFSPMVCNSTPQLSALSTIFYTREEPKFVIEEYFELLFSSLVQLSFSAQEVGTLQKIHTTSYN